MGGADPLGPSAACPLAGRCEACGTTRALARILELAPFSKNAGWARAVGRQER